MTLVASVNRKDDNPAWDVQQNGENSRCGRQMGPRSFVSAAVVISLSLVTAFHSHSADTAPSTNAALTGWRDFQKHLHKPAINLVYIIVTIATCAPLIWAGEIRSVAVLNVTFHSAAFLSKHTVLGVFVLILTILVQADTCASQTCIVIQELNALPVAHDIKHNFRFKQETIKKANKKH